jgi:hypothetical protein
MKHLQNLKGTRWWIVLQERGWEQHKASELHKREKAWLKREQKNVMNVGARPADSEAAPEEMLQTVAILTALASDKTEQRIWNRRPDAREADNQTHSQHMPPASTSERAASRAIRCE